MVLLRRSAIALICATLLSGGPLGAGEGDDAVLSELRQEIEDVESRIRALEDERSGALYDVERLDLQLERQRRLLARLAHEERSNRQALERLVDEQARLEAKQQRQKTELSLRMDGLYRMGRMSYLRLFLSTDSPELLRERLRYLSYLAGRDSRLIRGCLATLAQLERGRAELHTREEQLARITAEEQRREASTERLRRDKARLVGQLEEKIGAHREIAAELDLAAERLEQVIGSLDGDAAAAADRARLLPGLDNYRGLLPWPAAGAVSGRFGRKRHPRFGTTTISNGILIDVPPGSRAAAVYFGAVVYDDWLHGYGNLVILSHGGDSYSLYAHLQSSAVSVGEWVNKGDRVGATGASGSLSGPALYFELRIRGEPVDPLKWLEKR